MRRIIVNNIVSLDGCYADATGDPLALNMDAAFDRANLDSISQADLGIRSTGSARTGRSWRMRRSRRIRARPKPARSAR